MNTASTLHNSDSLAAWALWVSPSASDMQQLRSCDDEQKKRTLLLHPKDWSLTTNAIETAIKTGFYQLVRLPKDRFHSLQQQKLELIALRNNVKLSWTSSIKPLNAGNQLSLI